MIPKRWTFLASTALLLIAGAARAQVTVDGDLSDLIPLAQGQAVDRANDVIPNCKSGFDLENLYVFYSFATDQFFVGFDILDSPPGNAPGFPGPGVPGDADGDENPSTATNPNCPEVMIDQAAIGPDEEYLFQIDTDVDFRYDEHDDLRVLYRNNMLTVMRGDGTPVPAGVSAAIKLGTAGAPGPTGIPDENRATEDIELVVNNYSRVDSAPVCFGLTTFSGSLVNLPTEDTPDSPLVVNLSEPAITIEKTVRNVTRNTAFGESAPAAAGDTIRFRLEVRNSGNVLLDPVMVIDTLPNGLTFVAGSVVGADTVEVSGQEITLRRLGGSPSFAVSDTRVVTLDATVDAGAPLMLVNSATAGGRSPAECGAVDVDDTDTAQLGQVADLICIKQVSLDGLSFFNSVMADAGQVVFFRVIITNPGVRLEKVTLRDELPAGYMDVQSQDGRCAASGNTITCDNIGPLDSGASTEVRYRATVKMDVRDGTTLVNTAHVEGFILAGDTLPAVTDNCSSTVEVGQMRVPSLSAWGAIGLALLLGAALVLRRRGLAG